MVTYKKEHRPKPTCWQRKRLWQGDCVRLSLPMALSPAQPNRRARSLQSEECFPSAPRPSSTATWTHCVQHSRSRRSSEAFCLIWCRQYSMNGLSLVLPPHSFRYYETLNPAGKRLPAERSYFEWWRRDSSDRSSRPEVWTGQPETSKGVSSIVSKLQTNAPTSSEMSCTTALAKCSGITRISIFRSAVRIRSSLRLSKPSFRKVGWGVLGEQWLYLCRILPFGFCINWDLSGSGTAAGTESSGDSEYLNGQFLFPNRIFTAQK